MLTTLVPVVHYRICIPLYPGYAHPCTPDMHTLVPRICTPLYPGYAYPCAPDIHTRLLIPSHPGYLYPRTLDICTLVPRIFVPSYPAYSYPCTPYTGYSYLRSPIFLPAYSGYLYAIFIRHTWSLNKVLLGQLLRIYCNFLEKYVPGYEGMRVRGKRG